MQEFVARFRPFFVYAAGFSLVINLLMLMPALFMLQVYDRVITSHSRETLAMLFLLVTAALLFMAYLDLIRSRLLAGSAVALEKLLGPRVLGSMLRRAADPRPNESAANESTHGLRDVAAMRAFLTGPGIVALFDAPWVPVYALIIALFHPLLGAIAVCGALLLFAMAYLNERLSRQPLEAMQAESRKAGRFVDQGVANAEVAGALGMADNLARGWQKLSRRVLTFQLEASRAGSLFSSAGKFLRQFLQAVMLAAGAWLVIEQQATSGVMIAATILLGRALAPVEAAIAGWKGLVDARAAYGRVSKGLNAEAQGEPPTALPAPRGALSVERVVFAFRGQDRPVIRQVTFELAPGEALAIVGPSAAGKSTLARVIVGLWKPMAGAVRLDSADIASWPRDRLGPYVGYLPQDVELFAGTVSENIARMGEIDSPAVIEAATRANAHELILRLPKGYDTPIGEGGSFLSAGQRQRIALARALYGDPRLVVLDEPNSNLDADGEAALLEAVRRLKAERRTVLVVTHRPQLLAAMDKVMLLREGVIEKMGLMAEVMGGVRPVHSEAGPAALAARG
ncbi:MAG TPA: type I secretion system permease/ATPase [Burkholderiales bacterium]|nr:type I secretion system permease/ATPase [Burkholderiales bacterium]